MQEEKVLSPILVTLSGILKDNKLPKGINNLRIGEAILLGTDTAKGENLLN